MDNYFRSIGMREDYASCEVSCEICDGTRFTDLLTRARVGGPGVYGRLPVRACSQCGYVMINPRYERQFYIDYYRTIYRKLTHGTAKPDVAYIESQKKRGAAMLQYLKRFKADRGTLLDLGCGAGATMLPFIADGWDCRGIDPDEASVELGRRELGLDVRLGEAESLVAPEKSFDAVICLGTMEHCYDLGIAMEAVKRTLKEDGIFLMRNRAEQIWGSPLDYFSNNHYRYFTSTTLKLLMARYGFDVEDITYDALEGIPGEFYVVARSRRNVSLEVALCAIRAGLRDDPAERMRYLHERHAAFLASAKELLRLHREKGDDMAAIECAIRSGRHPSITIMMEASPEEAIRRAIAEAESALKNPELV